MRFCGEKDSFSFSLVHFLNSFALINILGLATSSTADAIRELRSKQTMSQTKVGGLLSIKVRIFFNCY